MERRKFPRYPFIADVEVIELKPPQIRIRARISDLGRMGCYVDTITPCAAGAEVLVQIRKNERTFTARGVALYPSIGMGMGLRFTLIEPADVEVLVRWIMELSREIPAPTDSEEETKLLETILEKPSMRLRK